MRLTQARFPAETQPAAPGPHQTEEHTKATAGLLSLPVIAVAHMHILDSRLFLFPPLTCGEPKRWMKGGGDAASPP